jgi:DNA-binding NarL/FixJ family response regulator
MPGGSRNIAETGGGKTSMIRNPGTQVVHRPRLASNERTRTWGTRLTTREREVLQLIADGKTSREIAIASGCSVKTAQTHRGSFMQKLHLHSTSEVVLNAIRNQIIPPTATPPD